MQQSCLLYVQRLADTAVCFCTSSCPCEDIVFREKGMRGIPLLFQGSQASVGRCADIVEACKGNKRRERTK